MFRLVTAYHWFKRNSTVAREYGWVDLTSDEYAESMCTALADRAWRIQLRCEPLCLFVLDSGPLTRR
jgi:hypothetical protein